MIYVNVIIFRLLVTYNENLFIVIFHISLLPTVCEQESVILNDRKTPHLCGILLKLHRADVQLLTIIINTR